MSIQIAFAGAVKAQAIPEVDFCALFDSYDKYEGKTISSTALMTHSTVTRVHGDWSEFYSLKCNDQDHFALPSGGSSKTWNFLNDLKPESNFIFEIKFVGRITISELLDFGDMGWTRAEIKIQRIKSSQLVGTEVTRPNWDASAPLTERAKRLQWDAQNFLKSVVIAPKRMEIDIPSLLSNDFVFTSKGGSLNRNEYLNLNSPLVVNSGEFSYGNLSTKRDKEGLTVNGVIETDRRTKDSKTFNCTMKYVLKDGFWVIKSAQLK
ncbi:MAG: hypothetical protein ACKVRN_08110 [Pyrinomonadaceae bacterium]